MFNYNHLYYFYVTAKSGGVNAAAKHLKISQPSLSSQIKTLERALDLHLFRRVGRNNELTPVGTLIYGFCRQMFELSEEMSEAISQKAPAGSRRIHIGVSDQVDRSFVIEIVSQFLKKHAPANRPKITVTSGTHDSLVDRLRFRELDVIVTQLAAIDPGLQNLRRIETPVLLAVPKKWKVRGRQKMPDPKKALESLIGSETPQWLMPSPRFKLRSDIDHFLELNEFKGRIVFESDVIASLVRSISDEIGIAFLPLIYLARDIQENLIQAVGPERGYWKYRVWLSCHSQNKKDPLIQSLAESFTEVSERSLMAGKQ
jgi:LysR family transcriptional regulator, transcriptional activator of nhaA